MAQTYRDTFAPPLMHLELIGKFRDNLYKHYATCSYVFINFPSPKTTSVVTQNPVVGAILDVPTTMPSSAV
jgi:hypothetical protein